MSAGGCRSAASGGNQIRALPDCPTFGLISACIFLYAETVGPKTVGVVGLGFVLLALIVWIQTWVIVATTEIAVTDRRVIVKRGLIRRSTMEMNLRQVESVQVNQTVLGRLLDYGTVTIKGTGSGIEPISKIAEPLRLRHAISAQNPVSLDTQKVRQVRREMV